jgi:hypothetical protein
MSPLTKTMQKACIAIDTACIFHVCGLHCTHLKTILEIKILGIRKHSKYKTLDSGMRGGGLISGSNSPEMWTFEVNPLGCGSSVVKSTGRLAAFFPGSIPAFPTVS